MSWISVDPGLGGTGVAIWDSPSTGTSIPIKPKVILGMKYKTKNEYMKHFQKLFQLHKITECYCENASYFQGDVRGQVCATTGKLIKLAQFIGSLEETCRANRVMITLVPVVKWKGQVPKHITIKKILEYWPTCPLDKYKQSDSHIFDAVGIGLWKLGKF